ncbi:unnamed protein product [Sympodiomycopsis kandeliae]
MTIFPIHLSIIIVALATTSSWIAGVSAHPLPSTGLALDSRSAVKSEQVIVNRGFFGSVAKSISNAGKSVASSCCTFGSHSVSSHPSDFPSPKSSLGVSSTPRQSAGSGSTSSSHLHIPDRLLPPSPTRYSRPRESLSGLNTPAQRVSPPRQGPLRIDGHVTPPSPGSLQSSTPSSPHKSKGAAAPSSSSSSSHSPGWHPASDAGPSGTSHHSPRAGPTRRANLDFQIGPRLLVRDSDRGRTLLDRGYKTRTVHDHFESRGNLNSTAKKVGGCCSGGSTSVASHPGSAHSRPASKSSPRVSGPNTPYAASPSPSHVAAPSSGAGSGHSGGSTPSHYMYVMDNSPPESRPNFSSSGRSKSSSKTSFLSEPRHDWPVAAPSMHSSSLSPHSTAPHSPSSSSSSSPPPLSRPLRISAAEKSLGPPRYSKNAAAEDAKAAATFANTNGKGKAPVQASGWGTSSSSSSNSHSSKGSPPHSVAGPSGGKKHR